MHAKKMSTLGRWVEGSPVVLSLGVLVRAAFQWAIVIVLARAGDASEVGVLSSALAVTSPIAIFLAMGMRNVYLTHDFRQPISWYLRFRVQMMTLAVLVSTTVGLLFGQIDTWVVVIVALTKAFESMLDMLYVMDQEGWSPGRVGIVMSVSGAISFTAFSVSYLISDSLLVSTSFWCGSSAAVFFGYWLSVRARYRKEFDTPSDSDRRRVIRSGLATGVAQTSATLQVQAPVLFLTVAGQPEEVGKFAVLFYFVTMFNLAISAFQQAALPYVVRKDADPGVLRNVLFLFFGLGVVSAAAVFVLGRPLVLLLYGPEFDSGWLVYAACGLAILASGSTTGVGLWLLVRRRYSRQMIASVLSVCVSLLYGFLIFSDMDVAGALSIVVIGFIARTMLGVILGRS